MLVYCSSMMAGAKHDNDQLPVVVLGGAGGRIKGGRVLDYTGKPDRQLCRLFMSLMDRSRSARRPSGMPSRCSRKSESADGC
ncbi:hypothetical protein EMGBS8_16490 [Verrucomicrobiota bacterium]|nr:hypothetical protein EMGBS8_16490 [Verrucomicrobiota bacterium]